ncbi:MAG: galactitol-1-phosphate 5-dehydrogenase [Lachnospiraceae bacterium]|nr:galactitol-1-phosphate 5-dehydrogenase [Lachnospiraceae bacterium]
MKAQVLYKIGDLRYEDRDKPGVKEGNVLVRVRAAGICGSDVPRILKNGAHIHPIVCGHEFAGEVVEGDKKLLGKRVTVFPLIPCRKCKMCEAGQYQLCRHYDYLGSRSDGAFGEYVSVPVENLAEIGDNVSFEAAAMTEPFSVAYHAVQIAFGDIDEISPEVLKQKVTVWGAGTIGLMLTMLLKARGFKNIYVIGNREYNRQSVLNLIGDDIHFIPYWEEDFKDIFQSKMGDEGSMTIFDCVGRPEVFEGAVELAPPTGQIILVGNPLADLGLKREIYWKILRNELTLKGVWNSYFDIRGNHMGKDRAKDSWTGVLKLMERKEVDPEKLITHRTELKDLMTNIRMMNERSEDYIKVMCVM